MHNKIKYCFEGRCMSHIDIQDYSHLENLRQQGYILLYFYHPLCTACVDAAPALEALMQNHPWMPWSKVLLEKHPDIAAQNMVFIVPALIIVHQESEVYRQSRFIDIRELENTLSTLKIQREPGSHE